MSVKDEYYFMQKAIKQAERAKDLDEVPIGAIIVRNGEIIARAFNQREKSQNAVYHAEILAIMRACKKLGSWRLDDCDMYVTLEPCFMCAGAIINSRIKKLWFGAYEKKSGAVTSVYQLLDKNGLNWTTDWKGGLLEKECSTLLKTFFANKRQ